MSEILKQKIIKILEKNLRDKPRTEEQLREYYADQILSLCPNRGEMVKMLEKEKDILSCYQKEDPQCSRCYGAEIRNQAIALAIKILT